MTATNQAGTAQRAFITWLADQQRQLAQLAQQAMWALEQNNKDQYLALLRDRAEIIADLAEQAEELYPALPGPVRGKAFKTLEGFSRSAQFSLELDSPFYMSALLFRDDHRPGEPDNLEVLIRELVALPE